MKSLLLRARFKASKVSRTLYSNLVAILFSIVALGFLLLAGIVIIYVYQFRGPLADAQSVWAEFGDYVGGALNPILSLLGLVALLLTVFLQSEELRLSRKELRLTRQELKKSAEAQEKAQVALNAQLVQAERTARLESLNVRARAESRVLRRFEKPRTVRERQRRRNLLRKLESGERELSRLAAEFDSEVPHARL